MKAKKFLAVLLACCMALALVACGGGEEKKASEITVQIGPNPETLDPALNSAVDGANMIITLFETLLIIDENNQVQPGQAKSYKVSDDGLTWTFTMRDGLKWSDGTELNAKDYEYTFKRICDPETAAPYGQTVLSMVDGYPDPEKLNVKASEDGKTLTIVLSYPCSFFDKIAAFGTMSPVQRATVEANGAAWATKPETYVCNGPYMIKEWVPGERIVCTKNPNYVGGWDSKKIVTENITFLLLEDSSAAYAAYQGGEAQMIKDVPTEEIPSLKKFEDGGDFHVDTILGTYYLNINCEKELFKDVNVRKALNLAIDRDYIAKTVMQGTYSPAYNFVGPGVVDHEGMFYDNAVEANGGQPYISKDYEANKAAAKKALADAGYPDGKGFPVITYSTNDAGYHSAVAEYLQECYKEVLGITMNIDKVEWSSFTPQRRAGDYEMARNGWVMDYNDASNLIELVQTGNGNNDGKYSNPKFDQAMAESKVADPAVHFQKLHEAETIMMEDYANIPVAYYNDFWLQKPEFKGIWHSPYGYWYLQYGYVE